MIGIICWLMGHPVSPTGRVTTLLHQMICHRCKQLFVMCEGQPGMLPWSWDFEWHFVKEEKESVKNN